MPFDSILHSWRFRFQLVYNNVSKEHQMDNPFCTQTVLYNYIGNKAIDKGLKILFETIIDLSQFSINSKNKTRIHNPSFVAWYLKHLKLMFLKLLLVFPFQYNLTLPNYENPIYSPYCTLDSSFMP